MSETVKAVLDEKKAKPDFLDLDKDGDKEEPMKKAAKDKKEKEVKEAEKPKYAKSLVKEHDDAKELGAKLTQTKNKKVDEADKEDPRFGRYKSSMTKTFETVDIEKATRKHAQAMGEISAALKDALSGGGAVEAIEISKQMEELNNQLEQEIESIIRSYDEHAAESIQESKQEEKQVVTETPQQPTRS